MVFSYIDMNKHQAHCDIEKIGNIIIMTELSDNTGASVTNSCGYIAKQFTEQNNLSLNDLIFIERYDERSYESWQTSMKNGKFPNYALVNFKDNNSINEKLAPDWTYLPEHEFDDLVQSVRE